MYSKGMTTVQISEMIEDIYGFEVSEGMVSDITDKHDARANAAVIRYLIADDGTLGSVHNEPYIPFNSTNLYVGFISSEDRTYLIIIVINKRFYAYSGCFEIVCYLLV